MDTAIKNSRIPQGAIKAFISKLSRGLMIPIAVLPVAGLFLGIGAGIENIMRDVIGVSADNAWYILPQTIKVIGDIVFGNLPLLFAIGVAIAFAEDSGIAAFTAFLSWIVFNITQSVFITPLENGYSIFWYDYVPSSVVTTTVGVQSTQSSVFGGIVIGLFAAWTYNKFKTTELPKVLGFFNGTRSVPIVAFLIAPVIGIVFLMVWPLLGILLEDFGRVLVGLPAGLDSLIFGVTERSLIPFGLHHAFYTPLWYTTAGGQIVQITVENGVISMGESVAQGDQNMWFEIQNLGLNYNSLADNFWVNVNGLDGYQVYVSDPASQLVGNQLVDGDYYAITEGANPGQYMQGKFVIMIFGLPAAGAAMIMAADKDKREMASSIIIAAAFTSFLTGITEPIEFTFLFLAPVLYGIHAVLAGFSFMFLDLLHASIGLTFSGGFIDFVVYGILPGATGYNTGWYWVIALGVPYAVIYYFVFYFFITKRNIATPGRGGAEVKLMSKEDFKNKNASNNGENAKPMSANKAREEELHWLLYNLGGMENLKTIDACITRLRLVVNDTSLVSDDAPFKEMGAAGVMRLGGGAIQVIFGARADKFKLDLMEMKKANRQPSFEELKLKYEGGHVEESDNNLDSTNNDNNVKESEKIDDVVAEEKDSNSESNITDYTKLTVKQLKEILDSKGINYSSIDKKKDLINLLKNNN